MLESFKTLNFKTKRVSLDPGVKLKRGDGEPLPQDNRYRELVGGLLYISIPVRPDIGHVSGLFSHFFSNPTSCHWAAGMHVLKIWLAPSLLV